MAAADAMVHATAGLTVLEAHIRGCPVVSYGFSAGHLRANNAAFERFGLAEVARSEHELESVLRHVTRERRSPDSSFASLPSIASRVLTVRPRVKPQPVWRLRAGRVAAAVSLASSRSPLVADALAGRLGDPLPGDRQGREADRGPHPLRQGQRHDARRSPHARRRRRAAGAAARRRATPALDRERCSAPAASAGRGPARRPGAGPGRARRSAAALGIVHAPGRAPTGSPSPSTTAPTRRARRRCWRSCARRGATATFFLAGEQVVRRPALAAEIVAAGHRVELHCHRHRNLLRLTPRAAPRRRRARPGGDRGGERPGDRRLPAALRDLQRRRRCGRCAAAAGGRCSGRGGGGTGRGGRRAESIARRSTAGARAGDIVLLHDADYYSAPRLLGAHRGGAADHPRGAREPRAEVESRCAAEPAARASTARSRRTLRRGAAPSCSCGRSWSKISLGMALRPVGGVM